MPLSPGFAMGRGRRTGPSSTRPLQERHFFLAQDALSGRTQQGGRAKEVVQEFLSRETWAHPLERPLELWGRPNEIGQFPYGVDLVDAVAHEALVVLIRQPIGQLAPHGRSALID